ncbi:hypothetical protein Cgig2_016825 [Carnegiea gigantea]|uniref:Poly(A) polymerase nucleotidyltransferase domain-containing protein n=1 Tax=Carnegiea gigantea TaxID=171969 RepID=A0A9Q1KAG4_9CARY|nr:hypothetical protein Cgig2_016825 [Carnegiea gigantea]
MSLAVMDALLSSIFISRVPYGNLVVQPPEFAVQPSNNRIGTLKINQSFNLSLWVSSSQRIGASGSRVLAISKDISGEVDSGLYESKDEAIKRQEVLGKLDEIVKLWVKNVSRAKGYNDQVVEESNAKILLDEELPPALGECDPLCSVDEMSSQDLKASYQPKTDFLKALAILAAAFIGAAAINHS